MNMHQSLASVLLHVGQLTFSLYSHTNALVTPTMNVILWLKHLLCLHITLLWQETK